MGRNEEPPACPHWTSTLWDERGSESATATKDFSEKRAVAKACARREKGDLYRSLLYLMLETLIDIEKEFNKKEEGKDTEFRTEAMDNMVERRLLRD